MGGSSAMQDDCKLTSTNDAIMLEGSNAMQVDCELTSNNDAITLGGSSDMEDDWEFPSTNDARTLVLVGKHGYGKSATGNSILGRKVFVSRSSMTAVTSTCQMESIVLRNGRTVNVIDTPAMFNWSVGSDEIGKEVVKCVNLAKDGIHAVIMVFSIRSRFSEEEEITLKRLQMFFGERIVDYMIPVFTGGDDLEEDFPFTEYLRHVPAPVQNIIRMCKNRVVLFDNKTEDEIKINAQVQQLIFCIDTVIANNGGKPFSNEIFGELKKGVVKLHDNHKVIDNPEQLECVMGGSSAMQDDCKLTSTNDAITLVLAGKVGYGKSATGNSILGRKAFVSRSSMTAVTSTCQMESTELRNGRIVNVIDTPAMFNWLVGSDEIGKEVVKCVNLAKDGIHAVIMVFSIRSRFSEEEEITLKRLQMFFGERIVDYMIPVFTGGDDLEEDFPFTEYLRHVPAPVQNIIQMCQNRVVLFDNKTEDKIKINAQVQQLILCIDSVIANNGGKPFSNEIFWELKKGAVKLRDKQNDIDNLQGYTKEEIASLKEELDKSYNEQLTCITEMVEKKLNSLIERLEEELKEEKTARWEAQKTAVDEQFKSDIEIRKLYKSIYKAEKENEEYKRQLAQRQHGILHIVGKVIDLGSSIWAFAKKI